MRVMLVSAELSPLVKVGGLADAVAGLRGAHLGAGLDVETVLPDYDGRALADERVLPLDVPDWAGPASARVGVLPDGSSVTLISVPGIDRNHPYLDETGSGWPDNDRRFFAFSAAVAALTDLRPPDVLHLNDWHTGAVLGFLSKAPPTVFTIHNLAYQGVADGDWLDVLTSHPDAYEWYEGANPMSGAIALADRVIAVSPSYAGEILDDAEGFGLSEPLRDRGQALTGILNGIDTAIWNPATDPTITRNYSADDLSARVDLKQELLGGTAWPLGDPVIAMVTRLTDQKGVDVALETVGFLDGIGARLILLGSGEETLAEAARAAAAAHPDRFAFHEGYDEPLAHLLFAASDLYLMPSRFEPCGLTQMQAMAYGSIPVATAVGGLKDTVMDDDRHRGRGTGFLSTSVTTAGMVDALHRAVRAWKSPNRRRAIQRRGMTADWSWTTPAAEYRALYEEVARD